MFYAPVTKKGLLIIPVDSPFFLDQSNETNQNLNFLTDGGGQDERDFGPGRLLNRFVADAERQDQDPPRPVEDPLQKKLSEGLVQGVVCHALVAAIMLGTCRLRRTNAFRGGKDRSEWKTAFFRL